MGLLHYCAKAHAKCKRYKKLYNQAVTDVTTAEQAETIENIFEDLVEVQDTHQAETKEAETKCVKVARVSSRSLRIYCLLNRVSRGRRLSINKSKQPLGPTWRCASIRSIFIACTTHHLLTVFDMDTMEQQWYYISNTLKKPQRISMCAFFTCVEQLNSYIKLLPSLYTSSKATKFTKPAPPCSYVCAKYPGKTSMMWHRKLYHKTCNGFFILKNIEKLTATNTAPAKKTFHFQIMEGMESQI